MVVEILILVTLLAYLIVRAASPVRSAKSLLRRTPMRASASAVVALTVLDGSWLSSSGLRGALDAWRDGPLSVYPLVIVVPSDVELPAEMPAEIAEYGATWLHDDVEAYGEQTAAITASRALLGRVAAGESFDRLVLLRVRPDEDQSSSYARLSADMRALESSLFADVSVDDPVLFAASDDWMLSSRFARRFSGSLCATRASMRVLAQSRGSSRGRWEDVLSFSGVRLLRVAVG
jgi:hypothetical protein